MKKALLLALLLGLAACKDEARVTIFQDMMYFLENTSETEGYVSPVTKITAKPCSQAELLVVRNAFSANEHPRQTVGIVVDEELTTADPATDFTLDRQTLTFSDRQTLQLPLQVTFRSSAAGKKIGLRLDYAYYDACPLNGRRCDRLTILVKDPAE